MSNTDTVSRDHTDHLERLSRAMSDVRLDGSDELPERIVQFGTGAFLRGFADFFIDLANRDDRRVPPPGRVVVIGSTGSGRVRQLEEQDGLFTLAVRGLERGQVVDETRLIDCVSRALSSRDEWAAVLSLAREPDVRIIISNTTEVGIAYDSEDRIDRNPPRSFPGKLTAFLHERGKRFAHDPARGMLVLPCELIESNGDRLREIVLRLASDWQLGADFERWVRESVTFCNTLVDRIVPGAPDGPEGVRLQQRLGYRDELLTVAEPYRLWAIEWHGDETFPLAGVDPGIILAKDIRPYRERKVRMLNGTHTAIVPAALLYGFEIVSDAVEDEQFGRFARRILIDEILPSLDLDREMAESFAGEVLERFANPYIRHNLVDITFQQTAKMKVRVLPSIHRYVQKAGRLPRSLVFGFAALVEYKLQTADSDASLPLDDADDFWREVALLRERDGSEAAVSRIIADGERWGIRLDALPGFAESILRDLQSIHDAGFKAALTAHLNE